jgi:hypothetical protein
MGEVRTLRVKRKKSASMLFMTTVVRKIGLNAVSDCCGAYGELSRPRSFYTRFSTSSSLDTSYFGIQHSHCQMVIQILLTRLILYFKQYYDNGSSKRLASDTPADKKDRIRHSHSYD